MNTNDSMGYILNGLVAKLAAKGVAVDRVVLEAGGQRIEVTFDEVNLTPFPDETNWEDIRIDEKVAKYEADSGR